MLSYFFVDNSVKSYYNKYNSETTDLNVYTEFSFMFQGLKKQKGMVNMNLYYFVVIIGFICILGFLNEKLTRLTYGISLMLFSVVIGIFLLTGTAVLKACLCLHIFRSLFLRRSVLRRGTFARS